MKSPVSYSTYHVNLQQHDYTWKAEYGRLARQISAALHAIPHHIEHVGSTAIPQLIAQPTIDILVGLHNYQYVDHAQTILTTQLQFHHLPSASTDTLIIFSHQKKSEPTHYLHLVAYQSPDWQRIIQFKQLLKASDEIKDQYAYIKLKLARQYADDNATYQQQKLTYIQQILDQNAQQ